MKSINLLNKNFNMNMMMCCCMCMMNNTAFSSGPIRKTID